MPFNRTSKAAGALWALAVCAVGLVLGVASLTGWIVLAALALLPPFVIGRFWKDDPTISERIHEALR